MIAINKAQSDSIQRNYFNIMERIDQAARVVDRELKVRLVVVTKGQPLEKIRVVLDVGARDLGENYVEEGLSKISALEDPPQISWHMIGHLQSRKASQACARFAWIHSLDSLKLAKRLSHFAGEYDRKLPVLLECNVSGETNKFGFLASQEESWDQLLPEVAEIIQLPNLKVCGLMTMAPYSPSPEDARPYFKHLRRLRDYFKIQFPGGAWDVLSMGMSMDFEVAIQEGATVVRVGEAILGKRTG